jgi:hypothetical protein
MLYVGICGAAFYANQKFINKPAAAAEVTKPCCAGKKK